MIQTMKRSVALLMVMALCLAFVPVLHLNANAADVNYVYSSNGKYIYNWGTRGATATFLSPNAEDFYTGANTYDVLSTYSGGTSTSTAPNSALYSALKKLMADNHSYQTSYDATKELYRYTDCQNSGGSISCFYTGKSIGPGWDGGATWNREHTWPNSKGLAGADENDIMMLRPTDSNTNSSRGNKAYGESAGYYNPNSASNGAYDLRGDVARIFLYVYVRWGNVNGNGEYATWGQSGVIESLDVLLEWMEADPVDTWELGRNDSVAAITGTRNVFVDYPEFAFLLFGEDVPAMTTPSGKASSKCNHNNFNNGVTFVATCTEGGYTLYTCQTAGCGYSYKANVTQSNGHNFVSGVCSVCGDTASVGPTCVSSVKEGVAYKLGLFSTSKDATYYFTGSMSGYYGATDTSYNNGIDVYVEKTSGGYHLYFNNGSQKQYINLAVSGTHLNFTFAGTATSVFTWDSEKSAFYTTLNGEICYMGTYGDHVTVGVLSESKYKDSDYVARMYTIETGSTEEETPCNHYYTSNTTVPTCTKDGYILYSCRICGHSYMGDKISATGHKYVNGVCSCGEVKVDVIDATLSFANAANRTSWDSTQQTWAQNDIKLINEKGASSSAVANFTNPGRFYKSSKITVEAPGIITKIVFDCNTTAYATALQSSISTSDATVSVSSDKVTVKPTAKSTSFVISSLTGGQVRLDSITVTCGEPEACAHANKTNVRVTTPATCTADGVGAFTCGDCGVTATELVKALGHNIEDETCIACGISSTVKAEGAQLLIGTNSDSDKTSVRLVIRLTTSKSIDAIGTYVDVNEAVSDDSAKKITNTVYSSVNANGYVVRAEEGSCFVLVEISNIPNASFDDVIFVKPFMTVEEQTLYGAEISFTVNELLAKTAN